MPVFTDKLAALLNTRRVGDLVVPRQFKRRLVRHAYAPVLETWNSLQS